MLRVSTAGLACALFGCGSNSSEAPPPAPAASPASEQAAPSGAAASPAATVTAEPAATTPAADPFAPPTDDHVRRDVTGDGKGILEVKPSDEPGKKNWNIAHQQYFWEKYAIVKREARLADVPNARLLIGGLARYEISSGENHFREFKVAWNEYEGIPRPTDEEAITFITQHLAMFLGGVNNLAVHGDQITITLAEPDEQEWVWHSPLSVSFNVRVKYDKVVSNTEIASIDGLWEARIYRDKADGPWLRINGTERQQTEIEKKKLPEAEVRALSRGAPPGS